MDANKIKSILLVYNIFMPCFPCIVRSRPSESRIIRWHLKKKETEKKSSTLPCSFLDGQQEKEREFLRTGIAACYQ